MKRRKEGMEEGREGREGGKKLRRRSGFKERQRETGSLNPRVLEEGGGEVVWRGSTEQNPTSHRRLLWWPIHHPPLRLPRSMGRSVIWPSMYQNHYEPHTRGWRIELLSLGAPEAKNAEQRGSPCFTSGSPCFVLNQVIFCALKTSWDESGP